MIVPLTGNVKFPITLDPTVWIFDDRKVLLEEAFHKSHKENIDKDIELKKTAANFEKEVNPDFIRPPVNKSINRFEREKILVNSYVMPISEFLTHAEVNLSAKRAILVSQSNKTNISLKELETSLLLFSVKGKPLKTDGPVYFYYGDGSNKNNPIKGVKKIIIE